MLLTSLRLHVSALQEPASEMNLHSAGCYPNLPVGRSLDISGLGRWATRQYTSLHWSYSIERSNCPHQNLIQHDQHVCRVHLHLEGHVHHHNHFALHV